MLENLDYLDGASMKIGVLALQGGFEAHAKVIKKLNHTPILVKSRTDLQDDIEGLILPGGESSTNSKLLKISGLDNKIVDFCNQGKALFGTCAGLILLAKKLINEEQFSLKLLDAEILRNAHGSQRESFCEYINIPEIKDSKFACIFIRAPKIVKVTNNTKVLANFNNSPILIKQNNILGATFHPELTKDTRIHEYFLNMCSKK